jgi:hypothetical protein
MSKPKSPDGKRVTMGVRFSEPDAKAIDAARGTVSRSEWLRGVALAAVSGGQSAPARTMPAVSEPVNRFTGPREPSGGCPHPKARIHKGLCGACGTYVGKI